MNLGHGQDRYFEEERPSRAVADLMQTDKMQSSIYSFQTIKPSSL
jgi:hypothetical protein